MAGLLTSAAHPAAPADDAVAATLRLWASSPFGWGTSDCVLSVLDYAESISGRRFEQRPHYGSEGEAARFLNSHGGLEAVARHAMEQVGWTVTAQVARGDVGLVLLSTGLTACLCVDGRRAGNRHCLWAAHGNRLIVINRAAEVVAWTFGGATICPRP